MTQEKRPTFPVFWSTLASGVLFFLIFFSMNYFLQEDSDLRETLISSGVTAVIYTFFMWLVFRWLKKKKDEQQF
ncbi:MAG: hypothetical protein Q4A16_05630 [Lautropia sp.]|nr:hypothetical protein [Lautropia sp.]